MDHDERLNLLDEALTKAASMGLILRIPDDEVLDGRTIRFEGRELVNFGSSSALGLEMDPRLRQAVCHAAERYGTQFSASRTYVSAPPYRALEPALEELFGGPVLISASTTLGHMSTLPTLVGAHDAVILDQQVHFSVTLAVNQVRLQGAHVEVIRHSRMDLLEERLEALKGRHPRVWYMADGVYSMYADLAPADELARLLDRYKALNLYVDDSHGMSWAGPHGRGQFLDRMPVRDRLVVACSLNKSFAAAGGALIFPDEELKRRVATLSGPMIFSGPIQPPMLGAALASARIHLSDEIGTLQARLREQIRLYNRCAEERGLPLVSAEEAPIRTVGVGTPPAAYELGRRLMDEGLFVNVAAFPAVPVKRAGIRASLTLHQQPEDIERLVEATARHLPEVLRRHGSSLSEVARTFGLATPDAIVPASAHPRPGAQAPRGTEENGGVAAQAETLYVEHEQSVAALDQEEWDRLLGSRGTFASGALAMFERAFGGGRPEHDWTWHYYVVRDDHGTPLAATFFTSALWKDDMLARPSVSERVEGRRAEDPYFLTSYTLGMGALITEGNHLYLDRERDWRKALARLIQALAEEQEGGGQNALVLRDIPDDDAELAHFLSDSAFVKVRLPDSHVLELDFADDDEFLRRLSPRARRHQLREVKPWEPYADVEVRRGAQDAVTPTEIEHLHGLYRQVHQRGLELNTFDLPPRLLEEIASSPDWELLLLYHRDEHGGRRSELPVAFGAHFLGRDAYFPLVIGLDYDYVLAHGTYRQMLWQAMKRARDLGYPRLYWGMGASLEKRRFGARTERRSAWVQAADHYNMDVLEQIGAEAGSLGAVRR